MRSVLAARSLVVLVLISLVLSTGLGASGSSVFAQDGSPVSDQQPADEPPVDEVPPTEVPTDIPPAPTDVPAVEPTVPAVLEASETPEIPAEVPVQPAADITLTLDANTCYKLSGQWQIFITMDQPQFPATATFTFEGGATATVTYQQSSFIGGRYYGDFEWFSNLSDRLVSITGAFPAELNPRIETAGGPTCGPPTATATTASTATATATATSTATATATVSNTTLTVNPATCYGPINFWRVFVSMEGTQFPATATLTFGSGATATVTYNQSSYINGRYYAYYDWNGNLTDYLVSISGAFPANLNPSIGNVTGPQCGPPTVTPTASSTATATATATSTATATPTVSNITLVPDGAPCYSPLGQWQVFVTMDGPQFPATATFTFASGATATVTYQQSSFIGGRYYGDFEWFSNLDDEFVSITGAFPANLNPRVQSVAGPNCGPPTVTPTATASPTASATTVASNTPVNTATATATASPTASNTAVPTQTSTATSSPTTAASNTPVNTATGTSTATATATNTPMAIIVTSASVNCRVGPSTSSASLGVVSRGTALPVRGAVQSGWTPVICLGQEGWISSSYAPTATPTRTATPAATPTLIPLQGVAFMQSTTNCFVSPSLSSAVIGSVNANARIPLRGGLQNGWYPVVCLGQDGWVLGSYVAVQTATPTRTATVTQTPTVTNTPMATIVTSANVNCRVAPSTSATVLGVVARGTALGVRGAAQGGWTPVICFGQEGWISSSYAPTATPTRTATRTATATPTFIPVTGSARLQSNTNCFAQPSLSSTVVGSINRNAVIPLLGGLQNGWYPVTCNGQTSWILGSYISVVTPTPTATATATLPSAGTVTTTARVNCRTAPNTSASIVTVVNSGTVLTLDGATQNSWTPVRCGGQGGWIASQYLR